MKDFNTRTRLANPDIPIVARSPWPRSLLIFFITLWSRSVLTKDKSLWFTLSGFLSSNTTSHAISSRAHFSLFWMSSIHNDQNIRFILSDKSHNELNSWRLSYLMSFTLWIASEVSSLSTSWLLAVSYFSATKANSGESNMPIWTWSGDEVVLLFSCES